MSSYWDGVKRRWRGMVDGPVDPPPKQGTGSGGTGHSGTGPGYEMSGMQGEPGREWELVYDKFRQVVGRDPYSFQELKDWWNSA